MLEASGKTPDGKTVVRGLYRFYETTGLPLDVILESLRERQMLPDWPAFVLEAVEAGMTPERAISLLEPALTDSYGVTVRDVVVSRLRRMITTKGTEGPPPEATTVLHLLASEYDRIYEGVAKYGQPTFEQSMAVIESVVGREVVKRMEGHVVGMQIVEKLPDDRLERL